MILTAFLLTLLAIAVCVLVVRRLFRALALDLHDTLLWLGLAEIPAPRRAPRRVEPAPRPLQLVR